MKIEMDAVTSEVMSELELTQHDFWNVSRQTGIVLNTFVKMVNAKNVLEIGTSNGYSGLWIAKALKQTGGHLTTIEFYEKRQSIAIENFKKCGVDDIITPLQGDACEVIKSFSEDKIFDVVFIDANKKEYVDFLNLLKPHFAKHAVILADNIISHWLKVQPFINTLEAEKDFQYEILELPAGLLIAYKN